jgi:UDP-N-acetylglucosamine 2-epimerase (non-hydrolysing)
MKILHTIGARPNFVKLAPVFGALRNYPEIQQTIVHTGQHYDFEMSEVFFKELGLPAPDVNLGVGSDTHARQTAQIMIGIEEVLVSERPDWVLVYGDVNSALAAAVVSAKCLIPVAHVEAGLRSFDRTMPEEVNRVVVDQVSSLLFTPSEDGNRNLLREGINESKIHFVGNVMIDSLCRLLPFAQRPNSVRLPESYVAVTLHRPSNVDDPALLAKLLKALADIAEIVPVVFPVHPRTRRRIAEAGISVNDRLQICAPLSYLEFLWLEQHALAVITDSGGIQEETTYLGIPCLTVRENTERPSTCEFGGNKLVGRDFERLKVEIDSIVRGSFKKGGIPPLWDGRAAERIAKIVSRQSPDPSLAENAPNQ